MKKINFKCWQDIQTFDMAGLAVELSGAPVIGAPDSTSCYVGNFVDIM